MAQKYVLSPRAITDIRAIADFIEKENPTAAQRFRDELQQRIEKLSERPAAFRLRPEYGPDIRVAQHGSYLIFYRINEEGVRIVNVIHGARDLGEALKDESP